MATHWTDKRTAVAMIGGELARRGWKLYGWKEDRSDSMTDYYDPESWDGLAQKDGALIVVGQSSASTGHQPVKSVSDVVAACERCGGSGEDPSGLTYQWAKENPQAFNRVRLEGTGSVSMLPDVVSPLHFRDYGPELCRKCSGGGKVYGNFRTEPDGPAWPAYQGNPKGRVWHVEKAGRVLASGVGVFAVADERWQNGHKLENKPYEHWDEATCQACGKSGHYGDIRREDCPEARPKLRALVDRMEAAIKPRKRIHTVAEHITEATPDKVTVRPGLREGFSEVVFPSKPDAAVRDTLKASGFRWSPSSACWYGRTERLPNLGQ